jgi:hypothetical protein
MLKRRIYAMAMLVLFCTMLVHAIIPHVHHQHQNAAKVAGHHHHHHSDVHQHNHPLKPVGPHDSEGLFDVQTEHHTHPFYNSAYTAETGTSNKENVLGKKVVYTAVAYTGAALSPGTMPIKIPPKHQNFKLEKPFRNNHSLRAPPFFG